MRSFGLLHKHARTLTHPHTYPLNIAKILMRKSAKRVAINSGEDQRLFYPQTVMQQPY
ncbi:hypothetical protein M5D96_010854 [Drosophila gunungcola]|uniref:Uncharacterized protein n=1 Tax=Drosophila gunungcola TaxID=103775 RepID=A0A9Q0BLH6_9MUSC|nr:hypothetical protein M5D96_010854 [Drosophila gunungcola]